jgi:hypothetical protein
MPVTPNYIQTEKRAGTLARFSLHSFRQAKDTDAMRLHVSSFGGEEPLMKVAHGMFAKVLVTLVLVTVIFIAVRAPYYSVAPTYEDGLFVRMLVAQPVKPMYIIVARIDGHENIQSPSHPLLPYEAVKLGGRIGKAAFGLHWMEGKRLYQASRFIFSLPCLLLFLAISCVLVARNFDYPFAILCALVMLTDPLLAMASADLQLDGSYGVFACGSVVFALMLIAAKGGPANRADLALLFVAGATVGMGKNEWGLCLLAASSAALIAVGLLARSRAAVAVILVALAGNVVGNIISWWLDRENYLGGLQLILDLGRDSHTAKAEFGGFVGQIAQVAPFIVPTLVGLLIVPAAFLAQRSRLSSVQTAAILLAYFFAGALFVGYLGGARGIPRYFAPAAAAVYPLLFVTIRPFSMRLTGVLLVAVLCYSSYFGTTNAMSMNRIAFHRYKDPGRSECVYVADSHAFVETRTTNLIGNTLAAADIRRIVTANNKSLCDVREIYETGISQ